MVLPWLDVRSSPPNRNNDTTLLLENKDQTESSNEEIEGSQRADSQDL